MCKYYLNASHSFQGNKETAHSHTFTIVLYVGIRNTEKDADVEVVDQHMRRFLKRYEGNYLNELPEFSGKEASLEDMGNLFYEAVKIQLRGTDFSLYQLDISDNPLSVYQVADRILIPTLNMGNSKNNYDVILEQKRQRSRLQKRG